MKTIIRVAAIAASAVLVLPAAAFADLYYYAPNTTSGAFNYGSSQYVPMAAQPYVQYGQQIAQQYEQQYAGYTYPYGSQSQSQYQYQSSYPTTYNTGYSYPSYNTGYTYPSYNYGTGYNTPSSYGYSYGYNQGYNQYGEYSSEPQSYSYPSGTTGPFGTQLCYWSDSSTYEPCGQDPQQWVQDPYTGGWY